MKIRAFVLAVIVTLGLSTSMHSQSTSSNRILSGSAGDTRFQFFYETVLIPDGPKLGNMGGGTISDGTIHRFMTDTRVRAYFGYNVAVEVSPNSDTYLVTFSPFSMTADSARLALGPDAPDWKQVPTPNWSGPAIRTVRSGDVLELPLMVNNVTGQKIVDYVTVQSPSAEPPSKLGPLPGDFIVETGLARDFSAEDAELNLAWETIGIDGKSIAFGAGVSGVLPYFYLPEYGRYVMSLTPRPGLGFRKVGELRGSTVSFTTGQHSFNIISKGRAAPGHGPFNLYVHADPAWTPQNGMSGPSVGVADPRQLSAALAAPAMERAQAVAGTTRVGSCRKADGEYSPGAVLADGGVRYMCANVRNEAWKPAGLAWVRVELIDNVFVLSRASSGGECAINKGRYSPGATVNQSGEVARCTTLFDAGFNPSQLGWIDVSSLRGDFFVPRIH